MELGLHCGRLDFHGRGRWHQHLYDRKMVSALVYADSWASRMTENTEEFTMTRNEAVKEIKALRMQYMINVQAEDVDSAFRTSNALGIAITALSGPTREQVKKAWRGEWKVIGADKRGRHGIPYCMRCEKCNPYKSEFCPHCGSPMTDEAVDILHKRLEALKDGTEAN